MGKAHNGMGLFLHCFIYIHLLTLSMPVDKPQGKHFVAVYVLMSYDLQILYMCLGSPGSHHTFLLTVVLGA